MRISDWSSDVCSSDLICGYRACAAEWWCLCAEFSPRRPGARRWNNPGLLNEKDQTMKSFLKTIAILKRDERGITAVEYAVLAAMVGAAIIRSEEHTSELPSLMRISYAVFCLKK